MRRKSTDAVTAAIFALFFSLCISWFYLNVPEWLFSVDSRLKDFLFITRGTVDTAKKVLIVDIDEKSLAKYGQWPWPRDTVAKLIKNLRNDGAGIIGLDIVFAENDRSGMKFPAGSNKTCPDNHDEMLAETIQISPVIGGYFFSFDFRTDNTDITVPAVFVEKNRPEESYIPQPAGVKLNIKCLQNSFYSTGFFNTIPDPGGQIRKVPLLMRFHDMLYPSLTLEMIRIYSGAKKVTVYNSPNGVEKIKSGSITIPCDRFARAQINYRGPGHTFDYISAADILENNIDASRIKNKFILVGTSAIGLADIRPTPMDTAMPGVEIHANLIDNILTDDLIITPASIEEIDLAVILTAAFVSFAVFYFARVWLLAPLLALMLTILYRLYFYLFFEKHININVLFPLMALISVMVLMLFLRYIFSLRQEKRLKDAFSRKVSAAVMNDILSNPARDLLAAREKTVSIFFSDIRSFTTISEIINNPAELLKILNDYLTPMADIIMQRQGTIDKYIGDAIMAYWNAPADVPDHADKAVESAIAQISELNKINEKIKASNPLLYEKILKKLNSGNVPHTGNIISMGTGINTGKATVGEIGSTGRSDYSIIGDNVNLASRLEGLCKYYGVSIIISENTKNSLSKKYILRELDLVKVKGKDKPVSIYEVINEKKYADNLTEYHSALGMYRNADFANAAKMFKKLWLNSANCSLKLYKLYYERCMEMEKKKITEFDGIFVFETKDGEKGD